MDNLSSQLRQFFVAFHEDCKDILLPPEAGSTSTGSPIVSISLVVGTRGYIEKISHQVNGCYTQGWYDACAVMIRRLIEMLIIEAFEAHNISHKIKGQNGDFLYLSDLIPLTIAEQSWNLSRACKHALPKLKTIEDKSAHSRRYHAMRSDIDKIANGVRDVVQELIYIAKLK